VYVRLNAVGREHLVPFHRRERRPVLHHGCHAMCNRAWVKAPTLEHLPRSFLSCTHRTSRVSPTLSRPRERCRRTATRPAPRRRAAPPRRRASSHGQRPLLSLYSRFLVSLLPC
jgi:hypothetical protein